MNQKRTKVFSALSALAATTILCLGVSCTQTTPDKPLQPAVAPTITTQPANAAVTGVGIATFTVGVDTSTFPAPTYSWEVLPVGGAWTPVTASATFTGVTTKSMIWIGPVVGNSGAKLRVTVTNSAGSVTSNGAATLTVNPAPADVVE